MNTRNRLTTALVLLLVTMSLVVTSEARVYLDITGSEFRKIPIAVPYFINPAKPDEVQSSGKEMADIVSRGLTFHGFLSVLDPTTYEGRQDVDWSTQNVDFAILGQQELAGSQLALEIRLLDVRERQVVLARRYRGTMDKRQEMLLKFVDEVILHITGERGVSLSKIAFISDASGYKEVYISDVLGDEMRQVTRHHSITVSPRFSPDGGRLAYTSYHRDNANLYITDLSQSEITKPFSTFSGLNYAPAWSPDGGTLALTLSKDGNSDLYLMSINGKVVQKLTSGAGLNMSPSWSPDGKRMAFCSDRSGTPQIYIMDMSSGAVERLTYEGKYNSSPNWSPKGDWIAYASQNGSVFQIYLIHPEGGNPIQLTMHGGSNESPCFSPDGRQVVYSSTQNKKGEICAILVNGANMRPLFPRNGNQTGPQWSPRLGQ